jgi:lysophospholipase L1-like esterase
MGFIRRINSSAGTRVVGSDSPAEAAAKQDALSELTGWSQSAVFHRRTIQRVMNSHGQTPFPPAPSRLATRMPSVIRRVLFATAFLCTTTSWEVRASDPTGRPPPLPLAISTEITANLVNVIFLFDRLASDPPRASTPNYLARISDPSSPLYPDYVEYRQGNISRLELEQRLPHVATLGDSLTQHFYFSSMPSSFWRARTQWRRNWFLDTDPNPDSIFSVYERLECITPVVATEYNGAGALVAPRGSQEDLRQRLVRARNLPGQVTHLLHSTRFPDLIMIWIGHNNLDWARGLSSEERQHPEKQLKSIAAQVRTNYTESLQRLIDRARTENHRVAIVVFGLANIDAYLKGRRQAEILHAENPKLYPHFNSGPRSFESLKPPYQKNMARLALMINARLRAMVADLQRELNNVHHMQIEYSDALTKVDFSRLELINPVDGWHPSVQGHKVLAHAAFNALRPSLVFLRIAPRPAKKPRLLVSSYHAR